MNYYVPYFNMYPSMVTPTLSNAATTGGLFSRLLGRGLNWSSILSNTQKTLGIVNQAIPMFKQMSPVVKNAKTMFKIMNEFKKEDTSNNIVNTVENSNINTIDNNTTTTNQENINSYNNGPTFFLN